MKKILLFASLLLFGREDPFEFKIAPKTSPQSAEGEISKPLKNIEFTLPTTSRILKEIKFVYQKLDGSIATETLKVDEGIDWHYPISISQIKNIDEEELKKPLVYGIQDFDFKIIGKTIRINSVYKMKQIFVLPKPFRIIVDFERDKKTINQTIDLKKRFFQAISVETHKKFYRVSLELDGQYSYDLEQNSEGYVITLQ